ncbi:MAG: hypothetical protein HOO91_09190 [Bacteroidales bacterium]|nr:hypothetical protein [Bacteroidales bacterium]
MNPFTKLIFLCSILAIMASSCDDEPIETDPAKAILGKWILIEMRGMGTIKIKPNGSYIEYLKDGIMRRYDALDKEMKYTIYYFADSTLNVRIAYFEEDGTELWQKYLFKFSDKNSILTTDMSPWADAMFDVFVEKRIE